MPTRLRALALTVGLAPPLGLACGVCVEDRVAAVFDSVTLERALATHRHLAFFAIDGALAATPKSRRAILDALYASGAAMGTARVSLESASASAAFDPATTTLAALGASATKRLATKRLALSPLRILDARGVLREPD